MLISDDVVEFVLVYGVLSPLEHDAVSDKTCQMSPRGKDFHLGEACEDWWLFVVIIVLLIGIHKVTTALFDKLSILYMVD